MNIIKQIFKSFLLKLKKPEGINNSILPHVRTRSRITVNSDIAIKSSLEQMGSGMQLNKKQQQIFRKNVLKKH